jgi:RNA polymerase sigma factor for flagellar operon FliA
MVIIVLIKMALPLHPFSSAAVTPPGAPVEPLPPTEERAFQARVQRHLPLVRSMVDRLKGRLPPSIEAEELYSAGVIGLVTAARRYRADQGDRFRVYAVTRIRGAILDELRRLDCMSRTRRSRAKRLAAAIARLEQAHNGEVCREALCAELHLSNRELQELMNEARPVRMVSLDSPAAHGDQDEPPLHERIADDHSTSPFEAVERKERIALLAEQIAQLPELPRKVLAMHYFENLRLADIGACFGLTEPRVCQIRTQAIKQLRARMVALLA